MRPLQIDIVATVLHELEKPRTEADNQRVAIDVVKYASPLEIQTLAENVTAASPFRNWLRGLYAHVTMHHGNPSGFQCDYRTASVSRYSNSHGTAKTLIAGFTGKSQLIHGPTAVLLQYFPLSFDILILRDTGRLGFAKGMPGYSDNFQESIERIRAEFDLDRYEDIRCLGGSSGGAAAYAAGQLLGASKLVSFSGRLPTESIKFGTTDASKVLETYVVSKPAGPERAFAVFGANNANDASGAEGLNRVLGATLVPVEGVADHNVLRPVHVSGAMAAILQKVGLL